MVGVFPNEASCLRLVRALVMETSDEWKARKVYLTLTRLNVGSTNTTSCLVYHEINVQKNT